MKSLFLFITITIFSLQTIGQDKVKEQEKEVAFEATVKKWFAAWELVSKDIYLINRVKPVDFVFFDDKYVYSTSVTTIQKGKFIKGPSLMNLSLQWRKKEHNDTIILPDKSAIPVGLMSFAAEIPNEKNKAFFVMPLPAFWDQSGVKSKELGLDNLLTGVFVHEFSHSQQTQNFGKKLSQLEQQKDFGAEFNDNMVQHLFEKDSDYVKHYKLEVDQFYTSIKNNFLDRKVVEEGLSLMNRRHESFFEGKYDNLEIIDDFFLTMEGLGQYSIYLWLTHPKGGNMDKKVAIEGVRRKGKFWSQDEGFALFLILDQLVPPSAWAKEMFGNKTGSITELIRKYLK